MINDKADEFIEKLFESHLCRYQIGLEALLEDSDFIFYCVYIVL